MKQNQNRLKERREALNLTQKEVADRVGIAIESYQRYEYGTIIPSIITGIRIAKALETTAEALYPF